MKESIHVRQKNEHIAIQSAHNQRGQPVIVAESGRSAFPVQRFNLRRRHRVILIDDGQHLQVEQLLHSAAKLDVAPPIAEVFSRQKNLRNFDVPRGKHFLVRVHQQTLTHSGASLFRRQILEPRAMQSKPSSSQTDGSR